MNWSNTDPRFVINKRDIIVIIKPGINGNNGKEVCIAHVDTKEGWNIFTSFEGYKCMNTDDDWDETWYWISAREAFPEY